MTSRGTRITSSCGASTPQVFATTMRIATLAKWELTTDITPPDVRGIEMSLDTAGDYII